MLAQARSMRCCQECATEMGKAEQDLRNVLDSKLELIRRTLAVLDPSIGSRPTTSMSVLNEVSTVLVMSKETNSDRSALTLTQTDAEALYTALEAAQLKAADNELLRVSRQTYRQLVAHVALQEEVKALLAERPIGIRSLLEPLKRALQHATREQVHAVMLSVALQIIQSAEAECTLFGCHALCEKIERGSRRYSKSIARLEASLAEAQRRGVSDKLLTAAGALRDHPPVPPNGTLPTQPAPGSGGYVFNDGTTLDTLLQALEYRTQLVSSAVDNGTSVEGVSPALLEEATNLLKQLKKEVRDETKAQEERRKAEEEAALKAAKKSKKKKK
ncbi:hypothetical protein GQ600_15973 [Phytophthora cactorum]|nr:hypothetical protein GQ600_15973 [Phytophthora cactorum]